MRNGMEVWHNFTSFQSTSVTQRFLKKCYENEHIEQTELKSYDNCYSFIYYIEHGRKYYQLSEQAPVELKPILLFYGMIQLLKACILTVDPFYPENTNVLAHGVSTRKRKKRNYVFLNDEVKLQKNGLLSHLALKILHVEQLFFDRIKMKELFARIPELNKTFQTVKNKRPLLQVTINNDCIAIPLSVLDELKMTEQRYKQFLEAHSDRKGTFQVNQQYMEFTLNTALTQWDCTPFTFHNDGNFFIPTVKEMYKPLHEVIVHYLLLYNLSMVCRYEIEWWNELFHSFASEDLPFIHQFLQVTATKMPYLLYTYLDHKRNE